MADVFISHHTNSAGSVAATLCAELEKQGVSCWYAQRDVRTSVYAGEITKAIDQCKVFLLLLNEGANQSDDVTNEVSLAHSRRKKKERMELLPVRLDETDADKLNDDLRYYLNKVNIMDGGTPDAPRLSEIIERVKKCPGIRKLRTDWDENNAAEVIDGDTVKRARKACSETDAQTYFGVSADFGVTLRVLSADRDVSRGDADEKIAGLLNGAPAIVSGNGGMGKTSLMMRQAIRWARDGGIAVWLRLNAAPNGETLTYAQAASCMEALRQEAENGQRVLLCLENPDEGRTTLANLRDAWLESGVPTGPEAAKRGGYVQLLMAERSNRLEKLTARNDDLLLNWFDGASVAELRAVTETRSPRKIKEDYAVTPIAESKDFRSKVVVAATERYKKNVGETRWSQVLQDVKQRYYDKPNVSLVELIYRTLFRLKQTARKTSGIVMDWEEWSRGFPPNDYTPFQLYGGIAAFRLFEIPFTLDLFCRRFNMNAYDLAGWLRNWRAKRNVEPVIYRPGPVSNPGAGTIAPKHDVIAELFFLFQRDEYEDGDGRGADENIDATFCEYLALMNELEIERFLEQIVNQRTMRDMDRQWRDRELGRPNFREYFTCIFERTRKHEIRLSPEGMAKLCLGILWSNGGNRIIWNQKVQDILETAAPEVDETRQTHILYTEWGICLAKAGRTAEAEQKFRAVTEIAPDDLQSRTELGRLLSKQPGRQAEAEQLFREVIALDRNTIQGRVELGRLLVKRKTVKAEAEAEQLFREVMRIDPKNLPPRTELGRLLSKQPGRQAEAEQCFREAMRIDRNHLQSRTELGRLLSKQPGRQDEAEQCFRKVIEIEKENIPARRELAKLYVSQNRLQETKKLYAEILRLKPNDRWALDGLERVKQLEQRK